MIASHRKFDFQGKCLVEKLTIKPPFRFTARFENEGCFIYFLEGKPVFNSAYEHMAISSREAVLLKCGNYFAELKDSATEKFEILVVHLHPDVLKQIYKHDIPTFIVKENKSLLNRIAADKVIEKFVDSIIFYFENPELVNDDLLELKIKELVLLLLQSSSALSVEELFADIFSPREVSVKDVVNSHLFSNLSLEDLAALASMSVSTFKRSFQAIFDDTPANYIRNKRLDRAKELLKISSKSIGEVAFETCFNDIGHFSRSFKERFHLTPSEYRKSVS